MNKLLISLGLRSKCCGAKIIAWHSDKFYCEKCESWLGGEQIAPKTKPFSLKRLARARQVLPEHSVRDQPL